MFLLKELKNGYWGQGIRRDCGFLTALEKIKKRLKGKIHVKMYCPIKF
ncbi:hypothetical protein DCCM_3517 [Desulfocucumis palustris]|uniref:Uncharacterized protein n=1 Tax=Desulfocucumis palustris TaxID=1898651 RepID=A0A2L2XEH0_9FIRM|nr:hypothetical protein DCCM_3517 [Desulfocucumis palustris]